MQNYTITLLSPSVVHRLALWLRKDDITRNLIRAAAQGEKKIYNMIFFFTIYNTIFYAGAIK